MSAAMTRIAKKQGRLPALVAALGILAWMLLYTIISVLLQVIATGPMPEGVYEINYWSFVWGSLFLSSVPFALGVFVSLWAIAPVSHELTLRFVLTRGALAAAAGAVLGFVVALFVGVFESFMPGTPMFGNSFPFSAFDSGYFVSKLVSGFQGLILTFLDNLPLVLLATVLLWLWLKAHPREYAVSGLIDDV
jgi:hypothetical protein